MFYQPIFFKMGSMGSGCGWAGREVASGTRGLQFESNHWRNFAQTIYFKRYLSKIKEKEDENGSFFKKWQHRFFDVRYWQQVAMDGRRRRSVACPRIYSRKEELVAVTYLSLIIKSKCFSAEPEKNMTILFCALDASSPNDSSVLGRYRHLLIFICFLKYEPNPASFIYFRPFQNTMTNTVQNLIITA